MAVVTCPLLMAINSLLPSESEQTVDKYTMFLARMRQIYSDSVELTDEAEISPPDVYQLWNALRIERGMNRMTLAGIVAEQAAHTQLSGVADSKGSA